MTCAEGLPQTCRSLYPVIKPFDQHQLAVGDGHTIYVEQCGSPDGYPALVLHGGPGGGCSEVMRRYFDPDFYRIVLFDQRGCGRSRPTGCVEANTTHHLISDMELIREELGIERWLLFGGSWGATLSLIYAQLYPDRVAHLVLRSVFLMTASELEWFYGGGVAKFWPDQWLRFVEPIPPDERGNMIAAYHRRLFSGERKKEIGFGKRWLAWEISLSSLRANAGTLDSNGQYARAFARLESHYFVNGGFLDRDDYVLSGMPKLRAIGGTVIHGRFDMICPPESAFLLVRDWPSAQLRIVQAGHALSETNISAALVRATDEVRRSLRPSSISSSRLRLRSKV